MGACAVATCHNYDRKTKGTNIKYFTFPKNDKIAKKWINACSRDDKINLKNATICSKHFEPSCFVLPLRQQLLNYNPKNTRTLKDDAIPTLNLPKSSDPQPSMRSLRMEKRKRTAEVNDILANAESKEILDVEAKRLKSCDEIIINCSQQNSEKIQLAISSISSNNEQILQERILALEDENAKLQQKIEKSNSIISKMNNVLNKIFTSAQVKKITKP